jgi:hypothetical protein
MNKPDPKKLIQRDGGLPAMIVKAAMNMFIIDMQQDFGLDSMTLAAVIGDALGSAFACTDDAIEKDHGWEEGDQEFQPLKQTLLINFDVAYNEHRSKHLQMKCKTKPEPKIV